MIFLGGQTKTTYIHAHRNEHHHFVEGGQRFVFEETRLLQQPQSHGLDEVDIQRRVDYGDEKFGRTIPVFIDVNNPDGQYLEPVIGRHSHLQLTCWWIEMCRYEDAKDGNIDARDDKKSSKLNALDCYLVFGDQRDAIHNYLHKKLNLENPT